MAEVGLPQPWSERRVPSYRQLADDLGETILVPLHWPRNLGESEILIMTPPSGLSEERGYQIRGVTATGLVLSVYGRRASSSSSIAASLIPVEEDALGTEPLPFTILSESDDCPVHVLVRTTQFDVHIVGDALTRMAAIAIGRHLVEVVPAIKPGA